MADQYLSPTPYANQFTGYSNDLIQGLLGYMKDKQRTQQMQGLAGLLESTGIPQSVERAAYAQSPKALLDTLTNVNRANVPLLKAETADALMNIAPMVGPAARLAERGAMAAGRAGERLAERVVPQVMERGGLPAQLLGDLSQGTMSPLDVYHGTPHKLPTTPMSLLGEFDASKIGTGAGAQARGYGIYSSESPEFADYFAIKRGLPDLEGIALQNGIQLSNDARIELMRQATRDSAGKPTKGDNYIDPAAAVRKLQNASIEARQLPADKLQNTIQEFQNQNKAYLYKADLPDEMIPRMIDLDKPIKDQPEALKAIRGMIDDADILKAFDNNVKKGISGENAALNYVSGKTPADKSEALRRAGIPGSVYSELDTRNFVVFPGEEKAMKILERRER
jgi:hypothetical protein